MRGLLDKYPLGYEGYLCEKELAIDKQAFAATAADGAEPVVADGPVTGGVPDVIEPPTQKASSVVT